MTVVGIHRWSCWSDTTAPLPAAADRAAWEAGGFACRRRRRHLPLPSRRRRPTPPAAVQSRTWPLRPWRRPPSRSPQQQTWTSSSPPPSITPLMIEELVCLRPARSLASYLAPPCAFALATNWWAKSFMRRLVYIGRGSAAVFLNAAGIGMHARYVCDTAKYGEFWLPMCVAFSAQHLRGCCSQKFLISWKFELPTVKQLLLHIIL